MNTVETPTFGPGFSPLYPRSRSVAWRVAAVVLGAMLLAASSYIKVPMVPVPITMQTFAVTMIGALYGWRLGVVAILAWLVAGALGMPVLADGASGISKFAGPTAGYLFAFPVAGMLVGWLAERGWNGNHVALAFCGMLLGNALCLALGASWLSVIIGPERAVTAGVLPFLVGAILKSALGAATLRLLARGRERTAD